MPESERITRRDFLNGTLLASGAALVSAACPFQLMAEEDWNGASGVGDDAGANGNTHQVMADGHTIRDHAFERAPNPVEDTGEAYDCVVVGGGISGLAAALFYHRAMSAKGMGAKKIVPGTREPSDLWWRSKAQRVQRGWTASDREPGIGDVVSTHAGKFPPAFL